jgi:hypothetical protein
MGHQWIYCRRQSNHTSGSTWSISNRFCNSSSNQARQAIIRVSPTAEPPRAQVLTSGPSGTSNSPRRSVGLEEAKSVWEIMESSGYYLGIVPSSDFRIQEGY